MTGAEFSEEEIGEAARLVAVKGEMDISNAGELRTRVARALGDGIQRLLIDLSEVTHLDSSALAALIEAHQRTSERRGRLVLVITSAGVRRTIELRGLDGVLVVMGSRAEALSALDGPS